MFTWPEAGARVGGGVRLFYNRSAGPLPRDARPRLKAGLNLWEEILEADMHRSEDLSGLADQEWWEVQVQLPDELFRWGLGGDRARQRSVRPPARAPASGAGSGCISRATPAPCSAAACNRPSLRLTPAAPAHCDPSACPRFDFVVVDGATGAVDNNKAKDFSLPLLDAPTEQEVLDGRAAAYEQVGGRGLPCHIGRATIEEPLRRDGHRTAWGPPARPRCMPCECVAAATKMPAPRLARPPRPSPFAPQAESARRSMLQAEEERLWGLVEAVAQEAADKARIEFRWVVWRSAIAAGTVSTASGRQAGGCERVLRRGRAHARPTCAVATPLPAQSRTTPPPPGPQQRAPSAGAAARGGGGRQAAQRPRARAHPERGRQGGRLHVGRRHRGRRQGRRQGDVCVQLRRRAAGVHQQGEAAPGRGQLEEQGQDGGRSHATRGQRADQAPRCWRDMLPWAWAATRTGSSGSCGARAPARPHSRPPSHS
jgi:hypothetical protein